MIRKGGSVLDIAEGRDKKKTTAAGMTGDELIQLLKTSDEGKDVAQSGVVDDKVRWEATCLRPQCCSLCSACLPTFDVRHGHRGCCVTFHIWRSATSLRARCPGARTADSASQVAVSVLGRVDRFCEPRGDSEWFAARRCWHSCWTGATWMPARRGRPLTSPASATR